MSSADQLLRLKSCARAIACDRLWSEERHERRKLTQNLEFFPELPNSAGFIPRGGPDRPLQQSRSEERSVTER